MNKNDWDQHSLINEFLAHRFEGKTSIYIGIDLKHARIIDRQCVFMNREIAASVSRRFRNKINQKYFGNAGKRFGKGLTMTFSFHRETHCHLHGVVEVPKSSSKQNFIFDINEYCLKDLWIVSLPNISETINNRAVQNYNNRQGFDALVLF